MTAPLTSGAFDILADFAWADGEKEKAWAYLRKVRALRVAGLEEKSQFVYEQRFRLGQNLARAMRWGNPDPSLPGELKKVVSTWPEWKLTEELEGIRKMSASAPGR